MFFCIILTDKLFVQGLPEEIFPRLNSDICFSVSLCVFGENETSI